MLIAAASKAPDEADKAAKLVWEHYYCSHQKALSFTDIKILDPFMGGGTTLVEGSRLGMKVTGIDLNPVAWFVVKNELSRSDPERVRSFFAEIEREVKPRLQPFYTTTCPRGHKGRWVDVETGAAADVNPAELPPEARRVTAGKGRNLSTRFGRNTAPAGQVRTTRYADTGRPCLPRRLLPKRNSPPVILNSGVRSAGRRSTRNWAKPAWRPGLSWLRMSSIPR